MTTFVTRQQEHSFTHQSRQIFPREAEKVTRFSARRFSVTIKKKKSLERSEHSLTLATKSASLQKSFCPFWLWSLSCLTHLATPEHSTRGIATKVGHKYRPPELHDTSTEAPKQPDGIFSSLREDQRIGACGGQTLIMTASISRTF